MLQTLAYRTKIKNKEYNIKKEFIRKSIHLCVAFIPLLARYNYIMTLCLLLGGVLLYTLCELLRVKGHTVPVISWITSLAARKRDEGHFIAGPVTLGLGAFIVLFAFPYKSASLAIYALAFGDGLSSLAGKIMGKIPIPYTGGKTVVGSLTCFIATFIATLCVSNSFFNSSIFALGVTLLEMLPTKDFDNIIIPVGAAFLSQIIFF